MSCEAPAKNHQFKEAVIALPYTAPLDWKSLLNVFKSHRLTPIETLSETTYERVFRMGDSLGALRVSHHASEPQLILQVFTDNQAVIAMVKQKVRKMFDLDAQYAAFATRFTQHPLLGALWMDWPGQRLASGWDVFETSVNTILGQLVSVKRAQALMKQLIELYGEKVIHPVTGEQTYLFLSPETLAHADLTPLGTTQARKKTLKEFSRRVAKKEIDLSCEDIASLKEKLLEIPGIGPWSVEYIALRALGDADSFPATDLGIKRVLEKYPDLEIEELRPYRSYVAVCLWKQYLKLSLNPKGETS